MLVFEEVGEGGGEEGREEGEEEGVRLEGEGGEPRGEEERGEMMQLSTPDKNILVSPSSERFT